MKPKKKKISTILRLHKPGLVSLEQRGEEISPYEGRKERSLSAGHRTVGNISQKTSSGRAANPGERPLKEREKRKNSRRKNYRGGTEES